MRNKRNILIALAGVIAVLYAALWAVRIWGAEPVRETLAAAPQVGYLLVETQPPRWMFWLTARNG